MGEQLFCIYVCRFSAICCIACFPVGDIFWYDNFDYLRLLKVLSYGCKRDNR